MYCTVDVNSAEILFPVLKDYKSSKCKNYPDWSSLLVSFLTNNYLYEQ